MSYATISRCVNDYEFTARLTAGIAAEGIAQPQVRLSDYVWPVSAKSDIEAAYASALAAGNQHPGGDEAVITDQMILSAIQSITPPA